MGCHVFQAFDISTKNFCWLLYKFSWFNVRKCLRRWFCVFSGCSPNCSFSGWFQVSFVRIHKTLSSLVVGILPSLQLFSSSSMQDSEKFLSKCKASELILESVYHQLWKSEGMHRLLITVGSWGQIKEPVFCMEMDDQRRCDKRQTIIVINYEAVPLLSCDAHCIH